ncbi:MAG: sulfur carrier protein ThiS [Omnitrophica bacterium]|nr:sulfur carrier protein ThiS [Candidatus Omnitrophota bacterium]
MEVKINGKSQNISEDITLSELIAQKGLNFQRIVIEHNLKIIKKEDLAQVKIKEKDNIEIVSFLGGGRCRIC